MNFSSWMYLCEVKSAIDMGRHRKAPESLPTTVADVIAAEDALVDVKGYCEMMSDKFQLILPSVFLLVTLFYILLHFIYIVPSLFYTIKY